MTRRTLLLLAMVAASGCNCGKSTYVLSVCGLTVTPQFIDAGSVLVGTTSVQDLALSNGGAGPLTLLSATISGDAGSSFSVQDFTETTLNPGQPLLLHVAFSPDVVGPQEALLTIQTDACDTTSPIELTGVGIAYDIAVGPEKVSFDCVPSGTTASAQTVTVTNSGASPEDVQIGTFAAGSDFAVAEISPAGTAGDGGVSVWLDAGASLTVSVQYTTPADGGSDPEQGILLISACPECAPTQVVFNATTAIVTLSASPNFLDFGSVPSGEMSSSTYVTVQATTNGCDLPATLVGPPKMRDGAQGFAVSPVGAWPATLAAGETAQFSVEYTAEWAEDAGTALDAVLVAYSLMGQAVSSSPLVIPVQASSSPNPCGQLVPSPASLEFGTVATGQSANQTLTLTNNNTETCTLTSVAITANDAYGEFSLAVGTPTSAIAIPAGGSTMITAVFAPTDGSAPHSRTGTLTLVGTGVAPIPVQLDGTVQTEVIQGCIPQTLTWAAVNAGQLMNIDWGQTSPIDENMTGPAAVGATADDLWNPAGVTFSMDYTSPAFSWADGSSSNVTAEAINLPGTWGYAPANCNLMLANYQYSWSGTTAQVEFRGLPAGTYDMYMYCDNGRGSDGNSGPAPNNSGFGINVYETGGGSLLYSLPAVFTNGSADPIQWTAPDQYVVQHGICVNDGNQVELALQNGVQGAGNNGIVINGMQIVQTAAGACVQDGGISDGG